MEMFGLNPIVFQALCSVGVFLLLWAVLGNLVFKPFFSMLEEREQRTVGDETAAVEKRQELKVVNSQIQEKLRQARLQGIALRDERVAQAKKEAQALLDQANNIAAQELSRAEQSIEDLKAAALRDVAVEAENLSKMVVSKVLLADSSTTIH